MCTILKKVHRDIAENYCPASLTTLAVMKQILTHKIMLHRKFSYATAEFEHGYMQQRFCLLSLLITE